MLSPDKSAVCAIDRRAEESVCVVSRFGGENGSRSASGFAAETKAGVAVRKYRNTGGEVSPDIIYVEAGYTSRMLSLRRRIKTVCNQPLCLIRSRTFVVQEYS